MSYNINAARPKILIVGDEALVAADLEYRLKGLGFTVRRKAGDRGQALRLVERHQPDLVIIEGHG